jgi:hypothetical protein
LYNGLESLDFLEGLHDEAAGPAKLARIMQ